MKRRFLLPLCCASAVLSGCLGNSGSPVDPPAVQPVTGDSIAGVTWISQLGVVYFVFVANTPDVTSLNWSDPNIGGFPLNNQGSKAQPPALLCSAPNGTDYYFTVNARTGSSPGGVGSPVSLASGRPAGSLWRAGNTIAANINAIGYATLTHCLPYSLPTGTFVAVGPGGRIFNSVDDGVDWFPARTPADYTTDLYAVTAVTGRPDFPTNPFRLFVAVGAGGASILSTDGVTWTIGAVSNPTNNTLRAISVAGPTFVAVGDNGSIQTSVDGVTWLSAVSQTTVNLHAIECVAASCVAVGDNGVIDVSTNGGATWTVTTVGGGATALRAVAFGNNDNNLGVGGVIGQAWTIAIDTWVVAGDNGTLFQTSALAGSAGVWNSVPVTGAGNFVGIGYSTQFVALDANGNVFTSLTGAAGTWSAPVSTGVNAAIAIGGNGHGSQPPPQLTPTYWLPTAVLDNPHGFVVVGSAGQNASSF